MDPTSSENSLWRLGGKTCIVSFANKENVDMNRSCQEPRGAKMNVYRIGLHVNQINHQNKDGRRSYE